MNINCVDPLTRSALIAAIENENIELIRILLQYGIKVKVTLNAFNLNLKVFIIMSYNFSLGIYSNLNVWQPLKKKRLFI